MLNIPGVISCIPPRRHCHFRRYCKHNRAPKSNQTYLGLNSTPTPIPNPDPALEWHARVIMMHALFTHNTQNYNRQCKPNPPYPIAWEVADHHAIEISASGISAANLASHISTVVASNPALANVPVPPASSMTVAPPVVSLKPCHELKFRPDLG